MLFAPAFTFARRGSPRCALAPGLFHRQASPDDFCNLLFNDSRAHSRAAVLAPLEEVPSGTSPGGLAPAGSVPDRGRTVVWCVAPFQIRSGHPLSPVDATVGWEIRTAQTRQAEAPLRGRPPRRETAFHETRCLPPTTDAGTHSRSSPCGPRPRALTPDSATPSTDALGLTDCPEQP